MIYKLHLSRKFRNQCPHIRFLCSRPRVLFGSCSVDIFFRYVRSPLRRALTIFFVKIEIKLKPITYDRSVFGHGSIGGCSLAFFSVRISQVPGNMNGGWRFGGPRGDVVIFRQSLSHFDILCF